MKKKCKISIVTGPMSGHGGEETLLINFLNRLHYEFKLDIYIGDVRGDTGWLNKISNEVRVICEGRHVGIFKKYYNYIKYLIYSDTNIAIVFSPTMIEVAYFIRKIFKKKYTIIAWPQFSIDDYFSPKMGKKFLYADCFFAISSGLQKQLVNLGIKNSNIFLIYNPIKEEKETILPCKKVTKFIFIGRIEFNGQKNLKELFNACALLKGDWILEIFGNDNDFQQTSLKQCKEYIKKLHISKHILWRGWYMNPWEKIKRGDSLVLTSKSEGFGLVLCEAISRGLPVISSNCEAGPKDIVNDDNGFLYELSDAKQLAMYMQNFIDRKYNWNVSKLKTSLDKFYENNYYLKVTKILNLICRGKIR